MHYPIHGDDTHTHTHISSTVTFYRIPKLTVSGEGDEVEIEVSDNPYDSTPVDASNAPIIVTLSLVGELVIE